MDLLPLRVDVDSAHQALAAMQILSGNETQIFAPGADGLPPLAHYPAALGMLLSGDWLVGNRLAGVYAGMLTLLAVWLLACELFRHTHEGGDGQLSAIFCVGITGVSVALLHFSRLPLYLEPVAWGTLGLWALLRGQRTGDRLALGLSGLLVGLATLLFPTGRIFLLVALVGWALHWCVQSLQSVDTLRGGWREFLLWLGGVVVFTAPTLGVWLRAPAGFLHPLRNGAGIDPALPLWERLERSALAFNLYGDSSPVFNHPQPLLGNLLGPLLILGVGVLILNLDRVRSWLLLSWLAIGLFVAANMGDVAPDARLLLPVMPVVGLICGVAVDRWLVTLRHSGAWLHRIGSIGALAVLLFGLLFNSIGYYERYTVGADMATAVGRAMRDLNPGEIPYLLVGTGRPTWDDPVITYLAALPYRTLPLNEIRPDTWPPSLLAGSVVMLFPTDRGLSAELESRYPGGFYEVQRDRLGNPILIRYILP